MPPKPVPPHPAKNPTGAIPVVAGGGRAARWDLPAEASVARKARELTRTALLDWDHPDLISDVVLMVDELVTNALVHGRAPIRLSLRVEHRPEPGSAVVVGEVSDGDPRPLQVRELDQYGDDGRGLWIVRHLADEFGVRAIPQGKVVWFALAMTADGGPSDGPPQPQDRRSRR